MYFWYKLLTYFLKFFSPIYFFLRKFKNKEHPTRYKEKLSQIKLQRGEGFLVWFHAASVGEVMSIFPLIKNFEEDEKIEKILVTTITLSSAEVLKKNFIKSKKVTHQFLPLDIPNFVNKFLEHWSPNLSIFIDSEIWPTLIFQIKKKNIPLFLVNGRITKKSFLRWRLVKNFAKEIFEKFDVCIASNKESENYLSMLGARNIKNYGNLKFANVKSDNKLDLINISKFKNRNVWCAASTHPSEELFCAKTHQNIKKMYKNVLTIIIPRHIDRVEQIKKELSNLNLKITLGNNHEQIDDDSDILLVNSYGEALKFYRISKCVFLGKSLNKSLIMNSGQNPIEASKLGCKIFHGPNVTNFSEIYDYLKSLGVSKKINNIEELSQSVINEFSKSESNNAEIIKKIENYGHGILNNVMKELKVYTNI